MFAGEPTGFLAESAADLLGLCWSWGRKALTIFLVIWAWVAF